MCREASQRRLGLHATVISIARQVNIQKSIGPYLSLSLSLSFSLSLLPLFLSNTLTLILTHAFSALSDAHTHTFSLFLQSVLGGEGYKLCEDHPGAAAIPAISFLGRLLELLHTLVLDATHAGERPIGSSL